MIKWQVQEFQQQNEQIGWGGLCVCIICLCVVCGCAYDMDEQDGSTYIRGGMIFA